MAKFDINMRVEFSPNGDYLACSDSTGTLQIWDASTGTKKQQYVLDTHLSTTCSCISWAPKRRTGTNQESQSMKKKKRRLDTKKSVDELELIAIGTESGTILLYSYTKNDLQTELSDGHTSCVTDIAWNQSGNSLYSCSTDGYIVDWSLAKSQQKEQVNPSSGKKTIGKTIVSLTLPDDPARQLAINCLKPGELQVAVLTTRGKLAVFEDILNGPGGPLQPAHVVEINSSSKADCLLLIHAIQFMADTKGGINMMYSSENFWHPTFEKHN